MNFVLTQGSLYVHNHLFLAHKIEKSQRNFQTFRRQIFSDPVFISMPLECDQSFICPGLCFFCQTMPDLSLLEQGSKIFGLSTPGVILASKEVILIRVSAPCRRYVSTEPTIIKRTSEKVAQLRQTRQDGSQQESLLVRMFSVMLISKHSSEEIHISRRREEQLTDFEVQLRSS